MTLRKGYLGRPGTQLGRTYRCPVWPVPSVQDTVYSIHLTSLLQTAYDYSTSHGASVFPLPSLQLSYAWIGRIPAGPLPGGNRASVLPFLGTVARVYVCCTKCVGTTIPLATPPTRFQGFQQLHIGTLASFVKMQGKDSSVVM